MVLQNIANYYLNELLSQYIEGYHKDQLNLKFGTVTLDNLKIKLNSINKFNSPVLLKHGFIGNLTLKINFNNLYSTQLSLCLNDIFLIFSPNYGEKYDEKFELEKIRAYKEAQFQKMEQTLRLMANEAVQDLKLNDSFITKLILQIFNNVQIKITNVHFRIEDNLSCKNTPFSFGITLENLEFVTFSNEETKFKPKNQSSAIFKLAKLTSFALYLNCNTSFLLQENDFDLINKLMKKLVVNRNSNNLEFILQPINFCSNIFIHRKPYEDSYEIPSFDIEMNLDKFQLNVNQNQLKTVLSVVDNFNRLSIATIYKKWRPELSIKNNAKIWWKFCITAVLETDVKRKQRNWSWSHLRTHLHNRKKYKELYKKKLLSEKSRDNLEKLLLQYEDNLDVLNLLLARNQAKSEIHDQLEIIELEKKKKLIEEKNKSWFGGWWSSGTSGNLKENNLIEEVKKEFDNKGEKDKLYKAINYDENQPDHTYPVGYAAQKLSFVIKNITFNVYNNNKCCKIVNLLLDEVITNFDIFPASNGINVNMIVKSLKIFGMNNENIPIIEPISTEASKLNALEINFELNPLNKEIKYDYGVQIFTKGLKVIYDKDTISEVSSLMSITEDVSLEEIQTMAALKLDEFKTRSVISLEHAIENHKKFNLELKIEPSFIIIPEKGQINECQNILLISLGQLDISTVLTNFDKNEIKTLITKSTHDKFEFIRNSAYENYIINFTQVQLILSNKENWINDLEKCKEIDSKFDELSRHIIYPISLNLIFSRSIITDDPEMALLKVSACFTEILLSVEDVQIIALLKIFLSLSPKKMKKNSVSSQKKTMKVTYENVKGEVLKALIEKSKTKKKEIDIINLLASFSIKSLVLELKNKNNKLVRCSVNDLSSECKITTKETKIDFYLEAIQFFCCMDYYYHINNLQRNILSLSEKEDLSVKVEDLKRVSTVTNAKLNTKKKDSIKQNQLLNFSFQMKKVDFIMMDDYLNKNKPSVIFNFVMHFLIKIQNNVTNFNIRFSETQMAITDLDNYLKNFDVHIFILQPCNFFFNVNIENEIQKISLIVEEIKFNISPNMVQIFVSMLSKLGSLEKKIQDSDESTKQVFVKKKDLLNVKCLDEKKFRFKNVITNENINVEDESLASLILDDCLVYAQEIIQQIVLQIKSIEIVLESGGISSKPLIKLNTNVTINCINYNYLNLEMQLFIDYYNEKVYTWEPIIDIVDKKKFSFTVIIQLKEITDNQSIEQESNKVTYIDLISESKLEITLTNMALKVLKSLSNSFSNAVYKSDVLYKEDWNLILNNYTDLDILLYFDNQRFEVLENDFKKINENNFLKILYKNSSCRLKLKLMLDNIQTENLISFNIKDNDSKLIHEILLNQEKSKLYYLNNQTSSLMNRCFIVDVDIHNNQLRHIDFHSNVKIHNKLNIPIQIYFQNENKTEKIGEVVSNGVYYLPINVVYNNEHPYVYIKPNENYILPLNAFFWQLQEAKSDKKIFKSLVCEPSKQPYKNIYIRYAIYSKKMKVENLKDEYERIYHFVLYPEFLLRNLLPISITYKILNKASEEVELKPGEDKQIYKFSLNSKILFEINYKYKSWFYIKENFKFNNDNMFTEVWEFNSRSEAKNEVLNLTVNYLNLDESGFRSISIFAPFWFINNSGVDLKYNFYDEIFITHPASFNDIQLFSFDKKNLTQKKKMQIALKDSNYSNSFSIDVVGSKGNVVVKMQDKSMCFFTIDISLSEILFTKIVKINSFYMIFSRLNLDLEISEDDENWILLKSNTSQPFFLKDNKNAKLFFRIKNESICSKAISLKTTQTTLLDVNNIMLNIYVEVLDHEVKIEVDNYYNGCAPALLINYTENLNLYYNQLNERTKYNLHPKSTAYFIWHNPKGERSLVWSTEKSEEQVNDLDKDSFGKTNVGNIFYISFIEDNQRIFLITEKNEITKKILKVNQFFKPNLNVRINLKGIGVSLFDSVKLKELCYFSISSSDIVWEFKKENSKIFKGLSGKEIQLLEDFYQKYRLQKQITYDDNKNHELKISDNLIVNFNINKMIAPFKGRIRRIENSGLYLNYSKSEHTTNIYLKLNKIQLDNQLDNYIFATIFCPVPPPKSVLMDLCPKQFIEMSLILQEQEKRKRFKYFTFLIQEFAIQLDLDFLNELQLYFDIVYKKSTIDYLELMNNSKKYAMKSCFDDNNEALKSTKHYFDLVHLSPIKMHLSFSLGTIESVHLPGILDYLVKSAGVTIMEFKDVVFKINFFSKENAFISQDEFIKELVEHYKSQTLNQFYVVIFGLDVIGNPVGFLLGFTQGVGDFFYEPAMGIVQGPEEFAEGLVLGVKSLFSSTVGGAAGVLGKMTGQLSEGISSLMNVEDRRKRRERLNKDQTILQNSMNLAKGFFSGITGLVNKPIEGIKKSGFEGLVKGVGHGVIGLVAQPTTGIIDFTSETLKQLQRSVNVSEEVKRQRLTRVIGSDNVLRSYNSNKAAGREILKNLLKGHFFHTDCYLWHIQISKDRIFLATNNNFLYVKKDFIFKTLDVDWHLSTNNISKVEYKDNYVFINIKHPKKALGLFNEKTIFEVHCDSSIRAKLLINKIKKLLKIND